MSQYYKCGIYKITSPSGKVYIGQSTKIQKRFRQYRRAEEAAKHYGVEKICPPITLSGHMQNDNKIFSIFNIA